MNKQYIKFIIPAAAFAMALGMTACAPKVENNGYVKHADLKTLITPGLTKDEVLQKLGSPSVQSTFGNDAWYYVTDRKEAYGFMKYDIVDQEVTRIEFDDDGKVIKLAHYDQSQSENISIVKRETATEGHSLGFFEQILGNIGRFNAPGGRGGSVAGRRGPTGGR